LIFNNVSNSLFLFTTQVSHSNQSALFSLQSPVRNNTSINFPISIDQIGP